MGRVTRLLRQVLLPGSPLPRRAQVDLKDVRGSRRDSRNGRAEAGTRAPATPATERAVPLLIATLVLGIALILLHLHARGAPRLQKTASDRDRAISQALSLLAAPPQASPTWTQAAPGARLVSHGVAASAMPEPAIAVAVDENRVLTALPRDPSPGLARLAPPIPAALDAGGGLRGADARPPGPRVIPDQIEGAKLPRTVGDPLAESFISGSLRWGDARDAPFVLLETRAESKPARARIGYGASPAALPPTWLELGEAPAQGWSLIRVDARSIDVLSPFGNPIRLLALSKSTSMRGHGPSPAERP